MINGHFDLGFELLARGADPNIVSDAATGPLCARRFNEKGEAIVSRSGQNTTDMANGPDTAVPPYPETLALLDELGVQPNFRCAYCGELQPGGR